MIFPTKNLEDIVMTWHQDFVMALQMSLQRRQQKNHRYSLRKFSKDLGLSVGGMSEILRGKRILTRERAAQVLDLLNLPEEELRRLKTVVSPQSAHEALLQVQTRNWKLLKDWRNRALLSLFSKQKSWSESELLLLAHELNIESEDLKCRLRELEKHDLLSSDDQSFHHIGMNYWIRHKDEMGKELLNHLAQEQAQLLASVSTTNTSQDLSVLSTFIPCTDEQRRNLEVDILKVIYKHVVITQRDDQKKEGLFHLSIQVLPVSVRSNF